MCGTCAQAPRMSKMIQIRHVPDALHQKLKQRAAAVGMSLSDYLRRELKQVAEQPSWDAISEMLDRIEPIQPGTSVVELLEELRGERGAVLEERTRPRQ